MSMPLVVSFYTRDTPYEAEVARLRDSCRYFGLEALIEGVASRGSWVANCALKGPFVLSCLLRHQRPILWLDADAEVVRFPQLFIDADFDLAAYAPRRLNSGTLYFQPTSSGLRVARQWARQCQRHPRVWDQRLLQRLLRHQSDLTFRNLPQGYCKIFDRAWREDERIVYIVHHQASRRFKRRV